MKDTLKRIIEREISRLDEKSISGSLDTDDVKSLESLTRSLKQLDDPPKQGDALVSLTEADLLTLAKMEATYDRPNIKPRSEPEGCEGDGPEEGGIRIVEEREDT